MFALPSYFLATLSIVLANPVSLVKVLQPLDDQLPRIARVGQSFSWTFSPRTFYAEGGITNYTTSPLPEWLSFDSETRTFSGTASAEDEGNPEITVTAHSARSFASSHFTFCVTHYPAPFLNSSIADQFRMDNPSLSSVFVLSPGSALKTSHPALRIPSRWSFSIGFDGNTFVGTNYVFYEARLPDGSALPEWMVFNAKTITLDGVAPIESVMPTPSVLTICLIASEQEGYMSDSLPFDLVLASHELSVSSPLPTVNITRMTSFKTSLLSPADFSGISIDGMPLLPANISTLSIDTSGYEEWLSYDVSSRTLSGMPDNKVSDEKLILPVKLTALFNQTVDTNLSIALVPSYFSLSEFPQLCVKPGEDIELSIVQYLPSATDGPHPSEVDLSVVYDAYPGQVNGWLNFDTEEARLWGTVPTDYALDHVKVMFAAYSHVTHSTSHASLLIQISSDLSQVIVGNERKRQSTAHPSGLSVQGRARLILGLAITFSIIGGACLIGCLFAAVRHYAKVEDTALTGEEGRHAWTDKDRMWYGVSPSKRLNLRSFTRKWERPALSLADDPSRNATDHENLELGLHRTMERSHSASGLPGQVGRPGVMSKGQFLSKIRETVRQVSNTYRSKRRRFPLRPGVIGRPILLKSVTPTENPFQDPLDGPGLQSLAGSTIMSGSPSISTAQHSIPRRRPDFAPPRGMPQVHFPTGQFQRNSTGSNASLGSASRMRVAESIFRPVSRPLSIRSGISSSGVSQESLPAVTARPRLVPFTSATRVPMPKLPRANSTETGSTGLSGRRVPSQKAKVFKTEDLGTEGLAKSGSSDELTIGMHYVRSLGADLPFDIAKSSPPVMTRNVRSSFSFLESSHRGDRVGNVQVIRALVRTGEEFKFRVQIPSSVVNVLKACQSQGIKVKTISGHPLPRFLQINLSEVKSKSVIEITGVATARDCGEVVIGVYLVDGDVCLMKIVVDVVATT